MEWLRWLECDWLAIGIDGKCWDGYNKNERKGCENIGMFQMDRSLMVGMVENVGKIRKGMAGKCWVDSDSYNQRDWYGQEMLGQLEWEQLAWLGNVEQVTMVMNSIVRKC